MTKHQMIETQIAKEAAEFGVPGFATPTWRQHYAKGAFAKGQRVAHQRILLDGTRDWSEFATIVNGKPMPISPTSGDWYLVRFEDGGELHIHETGLRAAV